MSHGGLHEVFRTFLHGDAAQESHNLLLGLLYLNVQQLLTQPDNPDNPNNPEPKPPLITNDTPQYSYLGSAQSPNTGDEAPIAVLAFVMLLSVSGMVVVIKKQKKN